MNKLRFILCTTIAAALCACRTVIPDSPVQDSALRISLANVSAEISASKATPSELGAPLASEFNVKVVRNSNGAVVFNQLLGEQDVLIKVAPDEPYTVTASYGSNPVLAMNEPYYTGTAVASVVAGQTKNVDVECKVGNALVSARFGSDQAGHARFEKYFSECALDVYAGDFIVSLPMNADGMSAYLRAGSDFNVAFSCIMKETGEKRSFALPADMIPQTLNAAEHLIITLDLKVETGVDITVSKAELVEVGLEQTIPFSWLPLPAFTYKHVFDADGILVGTDLACSASYPGCIWHAYVRNSAGTLVRTLSGKDALSSSHSSSSDWPYLPSGTYTATVSYEYEGNTVNVEGRSRTFTIGPPDGLKATASGFTSYDKYKEGKVSLANQCNGFMLYDVAVTLGISNGIKINNNYKNLLTATSGSVWVDQNTGKKNFTGTAIGTIGGLVVGNHTCSASFSFDGVALSSSFPFVITGIPYTAAPPTKENGWSVVQGDNKIEFKSDYLSIADGGTVTADPTVKSPSFFCPSEVSSINIHVAVNGTVFTRKVIFDYDCKLNIYQGSENIYSVKSSSTSGTPFSYSEDRSLTPDKNYFKIDAEERTELSGYARIKEFKVTYR